MASHCFCRMSWKISSWLKLPPSPLTEGESPWTSCLSVKIMQHAFHLHHTLSDYNIYLQTRHSVTMLCEFTFLLCWASNESPEANTIPSFCRSLSNLLPHILQPRVCLCKISDTRGWLNHVYYMRACSFIPQYCTVWYTWDWVPHSEQKYRPSSRSKAALPHTIHSACCCMLVLQGREPRTISK